MRLEVVRISARAASDGRRPLASGLDVPIRPPRLLARPHETHFLSLDSSKAREQLGWSSTWGLDEALSSIVAWYLALRDGADMRAVTLGQIEQFVSAPPEPAADS